MCTSIRTSPSSNDLLTAVQELAAAEPYLDHGPRLTRAQWPTYARGYYRAIVQALRVLELRRAQLERRASAQLAIDRAIAGRRLARVLADERRRLDLLARSGAA